MESKRKTFELEFNPHWIDYQSLEDFLKGYEYDGSTYADFISEEDKKKCIENDSMWVITYYPNTPISHFSIAGSSLNIILEDFLNYLKKELQNGSE